MRTEQIPDVAIGVLDPLVTQCRDGLLDARNGLMRAAAVADEFHLPQLHRDLMDRMAQVDDLLEFVTPKAVVEVPR